MNDTLAAERDRYVRLIVDSQAANRLIVAGPGTGKTYVFHQALSASNGRGLALTFINNLASDLAEVLHDVADSSTFHAFCRGKLHKLGVTGLTSSFAYFPAFRLIVDADLSLLRGEPSKSDLYLQNLDDSTGIVSSVMDIGSYYDAVGHSDAVYRCLVHYREHPESVPAYPLVVVDEYQDFSLLEVSFLDQLATTSRTLVAGDDDQAVYAFKGSSPAFIRKLAADSDWARFDLPFCSRSTEVVVGAVNNLIASAQARGLLVGRLGKPYSCYLPDKTHDSARYPRIVHAACTVERNSAPYIGRYVAQQIGAIPQEDLEEARANNYPAALVIGPPQFVKRVYKEIAPRFPNAALKGGIELEIRVSDALRYLLSDERSRLGWRVLLHAMPTPGGEVAIQAALSSDRDLIDLAPTQYRARSLAVVAVVRRILNEDTVSEEDLRLVEDWYGGTIEALLNELEIPTLLEDEHHPEADQLDVQSPQIICTTFPGSKGLSGGHVFIVGMNDTHFPQKPNSITDTDVCNFLVGLSRTRKQCQLVSCNHFGGQQLKPSAFLSWIDRARIEKLSVNAAYFKEH